MGNTRNGRAVAFELQNVTFNFPRLGKAWTPQFENGTSSPQCSVQMHNIPTDDIETLRELGVAITETPEGEPAVNVRAFVTNAAGVTNDFCVYDSEFNKMTMKDRARIGQGSKGHVFGYLYNNQFGTVSFRMTDIVVTDLVEYTPMNRIDSLKARLGR